MESIRHIFNIGYGPSSSHTMGPRKAAKKFLKKYPSLEKVRVTLYGALAATGRGHLTDYSIEQVFTDREVEFVWKRKEFLPKHPNAVLFEAYNNNEKLGEWRVYSIGGGKIIDDENSAEEDHIYPLSTLSSILKWCDENGKMFFDFVREVEGADIDDYLYKVWDVMQDSIERGLNNEDVLPGSLKLPRKAPSYYAKAKTFSGGMERRSMMYAYALAVSEENAAGHKVVTAPTCGASGVLPATLYYMKNYYDVPDKKIIRALATAGLVGNIVKENASISGAEVGCQGEVGTACAMASAAATKLFGGTIRQIEYAAEMGLEHHLGLTCDPIAGLVQIPCIERNAFAASRALNHATYVLLSDGQHRISFDEVVETMKKTGHDLPSLYKETSEGGLAILGNQARL